MPQRSSITDLPEEVKSELDHRLVGGGFGGYRELSAWLAEQGYEISKSALHRYGSQFEERLGALKVATEQARAVAEEAGDDEGALNDALIRLIQEKMFHALVEMENTGKLDLIDMGHVAAKLGSAAVQQKKLMAEVRRRAEAAADQAEQVARKGGLSDDSVQAIREKILGVAG